LRERSHWIAVVVGSSLVHSLLLLGLWDNPIPLASIGVEAITAEVVLGADTPAGLALTPSENEVQAATPVEAARPDDQVSEQQPERTTEQQPVKPDETRDQRPVEEREVVPEVRQQQRVTAEQPELAPQETREQLVAEQVEVAAVQTPQEPPREIESDKTVMTVEPLRDLPQEVKPVARPKPSTQKSKASAAASPSMPSTASSGVGRGRSDAVSNYSGLIVAHLARYKRYPTAARSNGVRGSGAVTFTIDGGGRVTSASVSRSTGSPLLDEELTAMVQRASPFPVPPGALSKTFTAPVFFQFK
jgi:protein TonB